MKLSEPDYEKIKRNIIKKLYSHGAFSKGICCLKGFCMAYLRHLSGFVGDILKDLIREKIVVLYGKTKHGDAYQLNIEKLKEIEETIHDTK